MTGESLTHRKKVGILKVCEMCREAAVGDSLIFFSSDFHPAKLDTNRKEALYA